MIDWKHGVTLGPLELHHLSQCHDWRNDYRIWATCRQNDLIAYDDQLEWYEKQRKDPSIRMYAIWAAETLVGVCGLTSLDPWNRRAEFSLYIGPEHQKRGYAKAALKTLFDHGFRTLGLNLIWGETFDGNPADKLFDELGMRVEGTRREFYFREGKFIDAHLYALLSRDWLRVLPLRVSPGHEPNPHDISPYAGFLGGIPPSDQRYE